MTAAKMPDNRIDALEEFDRFCRFIDGMHMGGFVENDFMSKKIQNAIREKLIPTPSPVDCREAFEKYVTFGGVKTVSDAGSPLTIAIAEKIWQAAWNAAKGEGK